MATTGIEWRPYVLTDPLASTIAGLHDVLRSCEDEAESKRFLPDRAVDALRDAGVFRISSPRAVGGMEADPLLEMEVFEAVTRISPGAGWNTFVGALHTAFPAAYLSDEATEAMFGGDEWGIVAGQMQPMGLARDVDGGMVVNGRYSWGSGISHASWVLGGVRMDRGDGTPSGFRVFVVPKAQVNVLDNWHVVGVSGSGSYDYAVEDVFVPDAFWFDFLSPTIRRGGPRYAPPIGQQLTSAHCGFALGAGERALEEITMLAIAKQRTLSSTKIAERSTFQHELGHAYARLSAARDHAANALGELGRQRATGTAVSDVLATEVRAASTLATEVALDVALLAMRHGGGGAVRLDSPIQRLTRELLVAQSHIHVAEVNYEKLGIALLDAAGASGLGETFLGYR